MVRLGIVSDSHQSQFWTERFLERANREKYDAVQIYTPLLPARV